MRKFICAVIAMLLLVSFSSDTASAAEISAGAAIVYEANTGTVLFEKNADERRLIASTTKIMTALVTVERCSLDETVTIPALCESVEGSSMYLHAGDKMCLRKLLYGLMLESGNDAAVAIACHVSGSISGFTDLMNERAKSIGCDNTHFENPHGLDSEEHYSSARDLALITAEALKNEIFEQIVSTKTVTIDGSTFTNHNKLLWSYDGMIGVKTGYTKSAGRILVSCAQRGGMRLICVTISDPDDWNDHTALLDEAFGAWRYERTPSAGEIVAETDVISGTATSVGIAPRESTGILVKSDAKFEIKYELPKFEYAPICAGERAGKLAAYDDGEKVFETELYYESDVKLDLKQKKAGLSGLRRSFDSLIEKGMSGLGYERK